MALSTTDMLSDCFDRIDDALKDVLFDLGAAQLNYRPTHDANSIAWLAWHLTRIQDDHIAAVAGTGQIWTEENWYQRFGVSFKAADTGYGHKAKDVAALVVESNELLIGYHEGVLRQTKSYLTGLTEDDLVRIVDENWDPPVTLGVRLISVVCDDLQHVGQAAYLKGILPSSP